MPLYNKAKNSKTKNSKLDTKILIVFNIIELFLIGLIILLFYFSMPVKSTKVLFIPQGNLGSIITYLNKNGYEMNKLDELALRLTNFIQSGWIDLGNEKLTKLDFINKLISSKAAMKKITLIPGETSYFFLKRIAKEFNLSEKKLNEIYNKYSYKADGNILAETYSIPIGMKEDYIIFYLFSQTNRKYEEFSRKIFGSYEKKSWYNYIILASIIQKEAATINEMPIVASVIHNRIKKGMKLQMDGTLNYGKYSNSVVTAKRIQEDKSSYNTYLNNGLPANPICAVSLDAIKASIFPVKSNYLYFVRDNSTGLHKFSSTYTEHQKNIKDNIGVTKNYSKVKLNKTKVEEEAEKIMITDVDMQKPTSIKDLFNNIK